jgi:hypothetical protein
MILRHIGPVTKVSPLNRFEDEEVPTLPFLCFGMENSQCITGSPAIAVRHPTLHFVTPGPLLPQYHPNSGIVNIVL